MSEDTESEVDIDIQKEFESWIGQLASLLIVGEPFFQDGTFSFEFGANNEIFNFTATRRISNLIPFPVKEEKPKRI